MIAEYSNRMNVYTYTYIIIHTYLVFWQALPEGFARPFIPFVAVGWKQAWEIGPRDGQSPCFDSELAYQRAIFQKALMLV